MVIKKRVYIATEILCDGIQYQSVHTDLYEAKTAILKRIDTSIADVEQYKEDNHNDPYILSFYKGWTFEVGYYKFTLVQVEDYNDGAKAAL